MQGSVNSAFVDGDITEEQCDYFYKKYIYLIKWERIKKWVNYY